MNFFFPFSVDCVYVDNILMFAKQPEICVSCGLMKNRCGGNAVLLLACIYDSKTYHWRQALMFFSFFIEFVCVGVCALLHFKSSINNKVEILLFPAETGT